MIKLLQFLLKILTLGYTGRKALPPSTAVNYDLINAYMPLLTDEIGKGEGPYQGKKRNNYGVALDRYWGGPWEGDAWCAMFVYYAISRAYSQLGYTMPTFKRKEKVRAKELYAALKKRCGWVEVEEPRPGDVVLWHRGANGARTGHIGVVCGVGHGPVFHSIEGNKGKYPSVVERFKHAEGEGNLLGFIRPVIHE